MTRTEVDLRLVDPVEEEHDVDVGEVAEPSRDGGGESIAIEDDGPDPDYYYDMRREDY